MLPWLWQTSQGFSNHNEADDKQMNILIDKSSPYDIPFPRACKWSINIWGHHHPELLHQFGWPACIIGRNGNVSGWCRNASPYNPLKVGKPSVQYRRSFSRMAEWSILLMGFNSHTSTRHRTRIQGQLTQMLTCSHQKTKGLWAGHMQLEVVKASTCHVMSMKMVTGQSGMAWSLPAHHFLNMQQFDLKHG